MTSINYDATACVFNIQRYSLHDGPGIRTIIFLKGCPLNCKWCFNPESQRPEPTEQYGKMMTVREVYQEIKKDQTSYRRSGGGITFSGGEALTHPEFVEELIKLCQMNGWTTAIETTGYASEQVVRRIFPQLDYVLMDIKALPDDVHKKGTGVSNQRILKHAILANQLAKQLIIRTPVIPTFNFSGEQIQAICDFVLEHLDQVDTLHLLPYETFGVKKYEQLNQPYELAGIPSLTNEDLLPLKQVVEASGLTCVLGG